jgi:hypothetical protein
MTPEDIYRSAASHNGRHLLRQRYRKTEPWEEPTALDREYEACQSLVYSGNANWLTGRSSPGIELTGKPLNEDSCEVEELELPK